MNYNLKTRLFTDITCNNEKQNTINMSIRHVNSQLHSYRIIPLNCCLQRIFNKQKCYACQINWA